MQIAFKDVRLSKQNLKMAMFFILAVTFSLFAASQFAFADFEDFAHTEFDTITKGVGDVANGIFTHDYYSKITENGSILATIVKSFKIFGAAFALGLGLIKMITEIQKAQDPTDCVLRYFFELCIVILVVLNIDKIIEYREENGKVLSRDELMKKKVLTPKAYEQSIGFMRIIDGTNPMDVTSIHPESYGTASKLLDMYGFGINDLGSKRLNDVLGVINVKEVSEKLGTDIYTLEDIIKCLSKPNRDFRDDFDKPLLKSDILKIEDLKVGMELSGTVRNVVDFGAFIDIGLHDDGLVHISKMTDKYIKHPSEVVSVGDIVTCYVDDISLKKNRVSLSLINPNSIKN